VLASGDYNKDIIDRLYEDIVSIVTNGERLQQQQQQYLFAIGGWKPEGHKPIKAGSKKK